MHVIEDTKIAMDRDKVLKYAYTILQYINNDTTSSLSKLLASDKGNHLVQFENSSEFENSVVVTVDGKKSLTVIERDIFDTMKIPMKYFDEIRFQYRTSFDEGYRLEMTSFTVKFSDTTIRVGVE